jgi:hypothetical protein
MMNLLFTIGRGTTFRALREGPSVAAGTIFSAA